MIRFARVVKDGKGFKLAKGDDSEPGDIIFSPEEEDRHYIFLHDNTGPGFTTAVPFAGRYLSRSVLEYVTLVLSNGILSIEEAKRKFFSEEGPVAPTEG